MMTPAEIAEYILSHEQDIADWAKENEDDRCELARLPRRISEREEWIANSRNRIAEYKERLNVA
jgi:hypothetical protein